MILLVNGPNLNLLGEREPDVYGHETLADVERMVSEACAGYGLEVKAFQSNWEGALLDFLQEYRHVAQGVILNPGALTHTSRALGDCLRALPCPAIEVHVSNIHGREAWRRESLVAPATAGQIVGLGIAGYYYAALHLCGLVAARAAADDTAASSQTAAGPTPREQLHALTEAQRSAPRPSQQGPGAAAPVTGRIPVEGEPIPVDLGARGDYEPL